MIKRIVIENYMAHKSTVLDLSQGVTVITGPNNSGKSAIVEAIRSIAQNPPGKSSIRHGERSAVVRVELDTGEIIEWERTEKAAVYKIREQSSEDSSAEIYAKFGRTPPEDVRALLRLDEVETETGPVDIHIGNQRYPIFLLDQSGSQAASFFAASTEAEYLLRMQQALKVRTDRSKNKRKELAGECADIERELDRLKPLGLLAAPLREAERLHRTIKEREKTLPSLDAFIGELNETLFRYSIKSRGSSILESLGPPPGLNETAPLDGLADDLEGRVELLARLQLAHVILTGLLPHPLLREVAELSRVLSGITEAFELLKNCGLRAAKLDQLIKPPVLHETADLANTSDLLARLIIKLQAGSAKGKVLDEVPSPPGLHDFCALHNLIFELRECRSDAGILFEKCQVASRLEPPPEIQDLSSFEALIDAASNLEIQFARIEKRKTVHESISPPPELFSNRDLVETLAQVSSVEAKIVELDRIARKQKARILEKREEIERTINEAGTCPLCGQFMDLAHFLEENHGQQK